MSEVVFLVLSVSRFFQLFLSLEKISDSKKKTKALNQIRLRIDTMFVDFVLFCNLAT